MRPAVGADRIQALLDQRTEANETFFAAEADRLARFCHLMAERFARGGRLIAIGSTAAARTDVRHVAVEFVHPVIVGKRALPAIGLVGDRQELTRQLELHARPDDIVITFGSDAVSIARERGCLTMGSERGLGAEYEFDPPGGHEFVRQELVETLYHVLWELVHVFFDHRGLLEGRSARRTHDAGASSFLYPFLAEDESQLEPVLDDVRRSALMKAEEIGSLRGQTLNDNRSVLIAAADALRGVFSGGGKLLALGNGGSATDAMDVVADLHSAGRPAIDLTADPSIITAIANDIGVEAIFSRQVIAYGLAGDALLALSTSGGSSNVIAALAEGRRRGMTTVAMVGYDGGRVAAEALADFVIVTRSEHIPRIQEAQASAYHVLVELVGGE
jgi:D-sedoheptulose 7-phosphate isomerase